MILLSLMGRTPFVSILIVNYNGRHLLEECLSSVFAVKYPKSQYEVILVDNCSSDDSVNFVKQTFPLVRIITSEINRGFAGGNVLGLWYSKGEYIVLLNNDARVDDQWLTELVSAAEDPNIGVVNSKLYFATPYLDLTIRSTVLPRSEIVENNDYAPHGVLIENVLCDRTHLNPLIWYGNGFYKVAKGEIPLRWTREEAHVLLPYELSGESNIYKFTVHGYPVDKPLSADFTLSLGNETILKDSILSHQVKEYMLNISQKQAAKHREWLVQNAGDIILRDGSGKDRGSVVVKEPGVSLEFYERDTELYSQKSKLLAFCGASCLIKRSVIEKVGFFHEEYFMYYEDLDLSLQIWTAGWDIVFAPKSIAYHKHRATSRLQRENATIYHLEKNYMAFVLTYFPLKTIAIQYARIFARFGITYIKKRAFEFSDNIKRLEEWTEKYQMRKNAIVYIVRNLPALLKRRHATFRDAKRQFASGKDFQY